MKELEFKTFSFEIKAAAGEDGIVEGYASTFGNVDQGGDVVQKGAFRKTIQESKGKFPILADHNPTTPLGWNSVAYEDEKGLYVKGQYNMESPLARERFALTKQALLNGSTMGLSIGYSTIKAMPDPDQPRNRLLQELKLWEYSNVVFPMNTSAMATGAKTWMEAKTVEDIVNLGKQLGLNPSQLSEAIKAYDPSCIAQSLDRLNSALKNLRGE